MQFSLAMLFSLAGPCHHAVQAFLPSPEALGSVIRLPGMENLFGGLLKNRLMQFGTTEKRRSASCE